MCGDARPEVTGCPCPPARAAPCYVREVIGMVEGLPRSAEAALDLEIDYRTGDPVLDEWAGRTVHLCRAPNRHG